MQTRNSTSTGLGDVRVWNDDGDGICQATDVVNATDELILLYQPVSASGVRTIAVNRINNVWVGGTGNFQQGLLREHGLLDGQTGELADENGDGTDDFPFEVRACVDAAGNLVPPPPVVGAWGGYGGLVDSGNTLWSASGCCLSGVEQLLRLDPAAEPASNCCVVGSVGCDDPTCEAAVCAQLPACCDEGWTQSCVNAAQACAVCVMPICIPVSNSYGLAIDMDGDIWNTEFDFQVGAVWEIDPLPPVSPPWVQQSHDSAGRRPRGVSVTPTDNHVWLVNSPSNNAARLTLACFLQLASISAYVIDRFR